MVTGRLSPMRLPGRRAVSLPVCCYRAFLQGEPGLAVLQVSPAHSVPALPDARASRSQAVRCFCQCWTWHALQGEPRIRAVPSLQSPGGCTPSLGVLIKLL